MNNFIDSNLKDSNERHNYSFINLQFNALGKHNSRYYEKI